MLIPLSVYRPELIYDYLEPVQRQIIGLVFGGSPPQVHMVQEIYLSIYLIRDVSLDRTTGMTTVELNDGTRLSVLEDLERVVEMVTGIEPVKKKRAERKKRQ